MSLLTYGAKSYYNLRIAKKIILRKRMKISVGFRSCRDRKSVVVRYRIINMVKKRKILENFSKKKFFRLLLTLKDGII